MPPFGLRLCFARGSRIFARFVAARPDRFGMEECAHESIGEVPLLRRRLLRRRNDHLLPSPACAEGASRILYSSLTSTGDNDPIRGQLARSPLGVQMVDAPGLGQ